jgi:hypothetical protein
MHYAYIELEISMGPRNRSTRAEKINLIDARNFKITPAWNAGLKNNRHQLVAKIAIFGAGVFTFLEFHIFEIFFYFFIIFFSFFFSARPFQVSGKHTVEVSTMMIMAGPDGGPL